MPYTDPSVEEINRSLRPHLCRCTGYRQIVDAIQLYSQVRQGLPLPEPSAADRSGKVGTSLARYSGDGAVLVYVHSQEREGKRLPDAVFAFRSGDPQHEFWENIMQQRESGIA